VPTYIIFGSLPHFRGYLKAKLNGLMNWRNDQDGGATTLLSFLFCDRLCACIVCTLI
jgi:hypothetical protein